jgi:hypothetical protein
VHHPDEAPIVKEIITRIASGEMTAYGMVAELNRRGVRTTEGNAWAYYSVYSVVHNPLNSARVPERQYEAVLPKRPHKSMEDRKSKHLKSSQPHRPP